MGLPLASYPRQSGFELLRLVAMLMVVVLHACYFSLGTPTPGSVLAAPLAAGSKMLVQSLTVGCVDVFVLLSGWFGISPTPRRLAALLFQVAFLVVPVYVYYVGRGALPPSAACQQVLFGGGWFVRSYVLLFALSPVLNGFVRHASGRTLGRAVLAWLFFSTTWGWLLADTPWWHRSDEFGGGYSAFFFFELYLLGRYLRLHAATRLTRRRAGFWAAVFVLLSMASALMAFVPSALGASTGVAQACIRLSTRYTSPLVIGAAASLLLCFAQLRFQSRVVNRLAASAFAVYLLHAATPFLGQDFRPIVRGFYDSCSTFGFLLRTGGFILGLYAACLLADGLRLRVWAVACRVCEGYGTARRGSGG